MLLNSYPRKPSMKHLLSQYFGITEESLRDGSCYVHLPNDLKKITLYEEGKEARVLELTQEQITNLQSSH